MRNPERSRYDATHARGWHVVLGLLATTLIGCGDASGPPAPGSIQVTTETTGFLKAEGYELAVDGVNTMSIGANEAVTVPELDPGSYLVELTGVPENCDAEGVQVTVESDQTAQVSVPVVCTFADPVQWAIRFSSERPDLDTDSITICSFGFCPTQEEWDLYVDSNVASDPQSIIRQNKTAGVEIAHVPGVTLTGLTEADVQAATFTTEFVDDPFDAGRVILIRTDMGRTFALGNPSEDLVTYELTFDVALLAEP
jgi:hypothetical protein